MANRPGTGRLLDESIWMMAAAAMVLVHAARPLWPSVVAHFPWRWWAAPAFLVVAFGVCFAMSRNRTATRAPLLMVGLMLYLFLEPIAGIALYPAEGRRPLDGSLDYLFLGFINLLCHIIVVLIFGILCLVQILRRRIGGV